MTRSRYRHLRAMDAPRAALLLIVPAVLLAALSSGCGKGKEDAEANAEAKTTEGTPAAKKGGSVELLNVSYDPTRELWRDLNEKFTRRLREGDRHQGHHQAVARRLEHARRAP